MKLELSEQHLNTALQADCSEQSVLLVMFYHLNYLLQCVPQLKAVGLPLKLELNEQHLNTVLKADGSESYMQGTFFAASLRPCLIIRPFAAHHGFAEREGQPCQNPFSQGK